MFVPSVEQIIISGKVNVMLVKNGMFLKNLRFLQPVKKVHLHAVLPLVMPVHQAAKFTQLKTLT